MSVRGVSLDAGGVLQVPDSDLVGHAVAPLGINPSRDDIRAAHYIALARTEAHQSPADYHLWITHYAEALGAAQRHTAEAAARLKDVFKDGSIWSEVVPGALKALKELERRRLHIAIISNTMVAGAVARSLARAGLCQVGEGTGVCVDAIVDSSQVGFAKPDPRIFHAALRAMDTTAEETVHVGDSLSADVRGAVGVGIRPIHYDPLRSCPEDSHDHLVDLCHLPDLLQ